MIEGTWPISRRLHEKPFLRLQYNLEWGGRSIHVVEGICPVFPKKDTGILSNTRAIFLPSSLLSATKGWYRLLQGLLQILGLDCCCIGLLHTSCEWGSFFHSSARLCFRSVRRNRRQSCSLCGSCRSRAARWWRLLPPVRLFQRYKK